METLKELGLAYSMISGGIAHLVVAFRLVMKSKAMKTVETVADKVIK